MPLIFMPNGTPNPSYAAFEADNAAEMALLINEFFEEQAAEQGVWDIELNATGAAPKFLCTLTVGDAEGGAAAPNFLANQCQVRVQGGIGQVDPVEMARELAITVRGSGDTTLCKIVAAGGGAGPHWMAIALTNG